MPSSFMIFDNYLLFIQVIEILGSPTECAANLSEKECVNRGCKPVKVQIYIFAHIVINIFKRNLNFQRDKFVM